MLLKLQRKKWDFMSISGYSNSHEGPLSRFGYTFDYYPHHSKNIEVLLGEYAIIFMGSVTAYFKFDENEQLIDIVISKYWDSL